LPEHSDRRGSENHGRELSLAEAVRTSPRQESRDLRPAQNHTDLAQSWHRDYSSGSVTDPRGPSSGSSRVGCGGSWSRGPVDMPLNPTRSTMQKYSGQGYALDPWDCTKTSNPKEEVGTQANILDLSTGRLKDFATRSFLRPLHDSRSNSPKGKWQRGKGARSNKTALSGGPAEAKPEAAATVAGRAPTAARRAAVRGTVEPTTAAEHAVGAR